VFFLIRSDGCPAVGQNDEDKIRPELKTLVFHSPKKKYVENPGPYVTLEYKVLSVASDSYVAPAVVLKMLHDDRRHVFEMI
jgi:hypothetical protein